jgi:hypothetical protein
MFWLYSANIAYVAILFRYTIVSRARTLKGLHIIDFHPNAIYCSAKAVTEYNRLRRTSTRQALPPITGINMQPPLARIFKRPQKTAKSFVDEADFLV